MEAKDLRQGNYVLRDNMAIEVFSIDKHKVNLGNETNFKPIPITEERLTKLLELKHERQGNKYIVCLNNENLFLVIHERLSHFIFYLEDDDENTSVLRGEKKYINEVQNLYFELTGTELTIK